MNTRAVAATGWLLARRALWHNGRPRRGVLPVVLTLAMLLAFGLTFDTLFQTLANAGVTAASAGRLLGWAFTLSFVMMVLGDVHVVVAALLDTPELDRLRLAPLGTAQLLVIETARTLPRTLPPVLGIALPAAITYAMAYDTTPWLELPVVLVTLWAVPLGLGTAIALVLLRFAPAARVREGIAALATFAFVAGWLANAFWLPGLTPEVATLSAWFRTLPEPPAWSPATWAAAALDPESRQHGLALLQCALAAGAAMLLAERAARAVLATVQSRAHGTPGRTVAANSRRARSLTLAFLRRDRALLVRDWPVVLDALASLALWTLLPLAVLPLAPLPHQELARDMLIALSVSLGNDIAARALPLERRSLAWARLSPLGGARWLLYRALGVAVLAGAVVLAATAITSVALGLHASAAIDVLVFASAAAASALASGLLVGALLGDPDWTDPRAMLGPSGRGVAAAVLLAQAAAWVALAHVLSPTEPLSVAVLVPVLAGGSAFAAAMLAFTARVLARREFTHG